MAETAQAQEALTQAPAANTTPVYEVGFHIIPTVGEEGVSKVVEKVRALLGNAEIIKESFQQKVQLSYTIERSAQGKRQKYTEAYFGWVKFATEREQLPAIEDALHNTNEVLRYLVISTTREDVTASRRAVFSSDRLEGKTIEKPTAAAEKSGEVSEEDLDKSIEALTG